MKVLIFLLLLGSLVFAQEGVFGTNAVPLDTTVLTNKDTTESRLITFGAYTSDILLYCAADSVATATEVLAEKQFYYGYNTKGDKLYGQWVALDSVVYTADIGAVEYGTGTMTGRETAITGGDNALGVQFRFWNADSASTRIVSKLFIK